ncbi:MAG: hypothetical protein Q8Q09_18315 [Deltaproteobacteria bacterium]|nr:hypothetical protein [Deltaproteobacteria bacterium]
MISRVSLWMLGVCLSACSGCTAPPVLTDASMDRAEVSALRDASARDSDAQSDARDARPPPWADGSMQFQEVPLPWDRAAYGRCEGAELISPSVWFDQYEAGFLQGNWLYYTVNGNDAHVDVRRGEVRSFVDAQRRREGLKACTVRSQNRLMIAIGTIRTRDEAFFRFADMTIDQPAEMLWSHREDPPTTRLFGWSALTATDTLVAFNRVAIEPTWSVQANLYVMNPDGTNLENVTAGEPDNVLEFRADGDRIVYSLHGQIRMWSRVNRVSRVIAPTRRAQWMPWISGDYVVWTDQRHGERGTRVEPDNPEIYLMNLRTEEVTRVTHDPPERLAVQDRATVQGDWVVWLDLRHATAPNGSFLGDRMAIYGYHIPSRREFVLFNDPPCLATSPVIFGEHVYFGAFVPSVNRTGMYRVPLPVVP